MEPIAGWLDTFNDDVRFKAISDLREELFLGSIDRPPLNPSPLTIGIEIEMTWRHAFPDLAKQWPTPSELDQDSELYRLFSEEYDSRDKHLKPTLESVKKVIPRVGFDAYWEFPFLPTKNLSVTSEELRLLYDLGILQDHSNYSLHMTVAGIDNDRDAFAFLCGLEMADGTSAERILEAANSKKGAWARKGNGGVMKRRANELIGEDKTGYEFRTLTAKSQAQINMLLSTAADLAHLVHDDHNAWEVYRSSIEHTISEHGLELQPWPRPKDDPLAWLRYIQLLESMNN